MPASGDVTGVTVLPVKFLGNDRAERSALPCGVARHRRGVAPAAPSDRATACMTCSCSMCIFTPRPRHTDTHTVASAATARRRHTAPLRSRRRTLRRPESVPGPCSTHSNSASCVAMCPTHVWRRQPRPTDRHPRAVTAATHSRARLAHNRSSRCSPHAQPRHRCHGSRAKATPQPGRSWLTTRPSHHTHAHTKRAKASRDDNTRRSRAAPSRCLALHHVHHCKACYTTRRRRRLRKDDVRPPTLLPYNRCVHVPRRHTTARNPARVDVHTQ